MGNKKEEGEVEIDLSVNGYPRIRIRNIRVTLDDRAAGELLCGLQKYFKKQRKNRLEQNYSNRQQQEINYMFHRMFPDILDTKGRYIGKEGSSQIEGQRPPDYGDYPSHSRDEDEDDDDEGWKKHT